MQVEAAFDPESQQLFASSGFWPVVIDHLGRMSSGLTLGPRGLPLFKPPYGTITALEARTGQHQRRTVNGRGPRYDLAELQGLSLPAMGWPWRSEVVATRALLFVADSNRFPSEQNFGGGRSVRALDKATGR